MRAGVDVGGTKIVAGIVSDDGRVVHSRRIPTAVEKGYEGVRDDIIHLLRTVIKSEETGGMTIDRIGVAMAGQIEKGTGRIIFSPNMGWRDVPLGTDLEAVFGTRVWVENDVNAATWGEWKFAFGGLPRDFLGIYVGTGIGGGLIVNGRMVRGFSGVGGEAGHITLNPFGYKCNCGNTGCFEAYCGGRYMIERVAKRIDEGYRGRIWELIEGKTDRVHSGVIEEAHLLGDELASHVWGEVVEYMGAGLAGLVNLLNPEVVVLGGGVVNRSRYLVEDVQAVVGRRAMTASLAGMRIEKAKLGEDAALLGASAIEE